MRSKLKHYTINSNSLITFITLLLEIINHLIHSRNNSSGNVVIFGSPVWGGGLHTAVVQQVVLRIYAVQDVLYIYIHIYNNDTHNTNTNSNNNNNNNTNTNIHN